MQLAQYGIANIYNTNTLSIEFFILSVMALVVACIANLLPDTADEPLLATCDQAEKFIGLVTLVITMRNGGDVIT